MAIYQIMIILITVMLWLTLRLKDVEIITTGDVARGEKSKVIIKKVNIMSKLKKIKKSSRKEIKVPEKRDISANETNILGVKKIQKKKLKSNKKGVITAPTGIQKPNAPRKQFSAIKK